MFLKLLKYKLLYKKDFRNYIKKLVIEEVKANF